MSPHAVKAVGRFALIVSLLGASSLVYACIGEDPGATGGTEDGGALDTGSLDTGSPMAPVDGGTDGPAETRCDDGTMCEGACVKTGSDPKHCGRCTHDCGGGTCKDGVCQPVLITGDPDGGNMTITTVTTDQTDDNPQGLAQHVFWSEVGGGDKIFQDKVGGGNKLALSTLVGTARTNVVANQGRIFWFSQNFTGTDQRQYTAQVGVAASQSVVGSIKGFFVQSITYDPTKKNIVGTYAENNSSHGIFTCGPTDGSATCTSRITYTGKPGGNIASDGTNVYFCAPEDGLILRTTLDGGNSATYASAQATPNLLRVDGNNVYWSNSGTKTIHRGPLGSASNPQQIATTVIAADGLAADAVNVYWTEGALGSLAYAPITGAGPNVRYVKLGPSQTPMRLVRDKGFLYFSHKTAIYRVALP